MELGALFGLVEKSLDKHGPLATFWLLLSVVVMFGLYEIVKGIAGKVFKDGLFFLKIKPHIILTSHSVFTKLESMVQHQIPNMYLKCPLRAKVFKKMLAIRISTLKSNLMDMAKKEWKVPAEDIKIAWDSFFAKLDYDWVNTAKAAGIPPVAIQRFREFREDVNKVVNDLVSNLCLSGGMYDNNNERIAMIFEVLGSMEVSSLFSAGEALDSLNGEISNIEFDGSRCQQCSPKCQFRKHDD